MKKLLTAVLLTTILVGCGEVETTSKKYKRELLEKVINEKDPKAKTEYENIIKKLEESNKKGATEELTRWQGVRDEINAENMLKMNEYSKKVADEFRNHKGNGW